MSALDQEYTEADRRSDFQFFEDNYESLFRQFGKCFLAIKNGKVLGKYQTAIDALNGLRKDYRPGSYSIQECNGLKSANHVRIQRMVISG